MHELFSFMKDNPFGTFLFLLCFLWSVERIIRTIANNNRPVCDCRCCDNDDDDDDDDDNDKDDKVIAMGGKVEDGS